MCGRYVRPQRYGQVRAVLEENGMLIDEAPNSEDENNEHGGEQPDNGNDETYRDNAFRPTYNFAPGYQGIVCRALAPDQGKKQEVSDSVQKGGNVSKEDNTKDESGIIDENEVPSQPRYKLQIMKWGLIPSWSKQGPAYSSVLKTINCRSDSLSRGGMWTSMRGRKRCVVVAQGFFEWLKAGPKERVPYYIRRCDGLPLLFAGLWDCSSTGGPDRGSDGGPKHNKSYTYTIITTDSNKQMQFLHDRMPVIFDLDSPALRMWLDPSRAEWSEELQSLLRPWPHSECGASLTFDVVSKEVNKVGHSSPSYVVPVASSANKSNIANFFRTSDQKQKSQSLLPGPQKAKTSASTNTIAETNADTTATKRKIDTLSDDVGPQKAILPAAAGNKPPTPSTRKKAKIPSPQTGRKADSPSSPARKQRKKGPASSRDTAPAGSQQITSFFGRKPTK